MVKVLNRNNLLTFALVLSLILAVPTLAAPKVSLPTRSTWDIDMIDADITGYTGSGVYVAVLDTGLVPNWKDYFPLDRIAEKLGKGFEEMIFWDSKTETFIETGKIIESSFIGSTGSSHGTHVTSTIIGYNYYSPNDAVAGLPLPPIYVKGVAPDATIIPIKVLSDYHIGRSKLSINYTDLHLVFGTDLAVATGIRYATRLKIKGYAPMIITMSLGGPTPSTVVEEAIDYAIDNGVIVVVAAGNAGDEGMDYPGAYPQVISVGAAGWRYEWYNSSLTPPPPRYRLWWLQDSTYGYNDVPETIPSSDVYITSFSSRQKEGQDLDVVAPGSWVRGPFPGVLGYSHLPWWSNGIGGLRGRNPGNFYYVGGTSMATPHVTSVIAQMLEKNPDLEQAFIETTLESTALPIPPGSMQVWDLFPTQGFYTYTWSSNATGSGLVQAKAALIATP